MMVSFKYQTRKKRFNISQKAKIKEKKTEYMNADLSRRTLFFLFLLRWSSQIYLCGRKHWSKIVDRVQSPAPELPSDCNISVDDIIIQHIITHQSQETFTAEKALLQLTLWVYFCTSLLQWRPYLKRFSTVMATTTVSFPDRFTAQESSEVFRFNGCVMLRCRILGSSALEPRR